MTQISIQAILYTKLKDIICRISRYSFAFAMLFPTCNPMEFNDL